MRVFLNKATTFLSDELSHIADSVQSRLATQQGEPSLKRASCHMQHWIEGVSRGWMCSEWQGAAKCNMQVAAKHLDAGFCGQRPCPIGPYRVLP